MSDTSRHNADPLEDTGVADVRLVRAKIAAQYNGNLRHHIAETAKLVEPLIEKLELKEGIPARAHGHRSRTGG